MEGAVYILCAMTALTCAVMLLRGFRKGRARLLFCCAIFFFTLAVENLLLFVDLIIVPGIDLSAVRLAMPLLGMVVLLFGLIWDAS